MQFEATTTINLPIETVFEFVSDFCRDPDWKDSTVACKVLEGDGKQGSRLRYTARLLGRTNVTQSIVTVYEPNSRVEFEIQGERAGRGWRTFEATPEGTKVTVGVEADLAAFFGPLASLIEAMGSRQANHELEMLKLQLEHAHAA